MAKKDNSKDETPIEFYVPGPGGRHSKVPIPINQPNWVYKTNEPTKPYLIEWFATVIILIIGIIFGVLLVGAKTAEVGILILTTIWDAFAIWMTWSMIRRELTYRYFSKQSKTQPEQIRKRKLPKRRKDFGR